MSIEKNIVLHLPFDEPKGSATAYDYSANRADGTVVNSEFVPGKHGQSLRFNGQGYCHVNKDLIPMNGNFSLVTWLKRNESQDGQMGKKFGFFFVWNAINGYKAHWIDIDEDWHHIAIVKEGLWVWIYLDMGIIHTMELPMNPTGFAILQDIYSKEYGCCTIDEIRAYDTALTPEDVIGLYNPTRQIKYLINGTDFKTWGVTVSESNGILDLPKLKTPYATDWLDVHGQEIDLSRKRVEAREIELNCWMKASGKTEFINKLNSFLDVFRADGTQRLTIDLHPVKPLLYEVYCLDGISISKRWNDELMAGTFSLKLVEPDPVKRVVRHQRLGETTKTLAVTFSSFQPVTVYWGDGSNEQVYYGENVTLSHDYAENGVYYAIVAGVIEEMRDFSTNGIVVWNKI
jgi:hypothetical protein